MAVGRLTVRSGVGGIMIVIGLMAVSGAGCGVVGQPSDLTEAQQIRKLEGHALTRSEIDRQLELADLMCGFDRDLLRQIWPKLDARQLEFQDFVFGERCPERISIYLDARPGLGTVPEDLRVVPNIPAGIAPTPRPTTTTRSASTSATDDDDSDDGDGATTTTADRTTTTGRRDTTDRDGPDDLGDLDIKGGAGTGG